MNLRQVKEYCLSLKEAFLCTPFDDKTEVMKHVGNGKMFVLFCSPDQRESINLKCEPMEADFLRQMYKGVIPGYHMNKKHWNTVYLDSDVPECEIMQMVYNSYMLTKPKRKKNAGKGG